MKWCDVSRITNQVTTPFGYGLVAISAVTLVAIAVDRLLAITTKHKYKSIVTKKRSLNLVIFLWIVPGILMSTTVHFRKPNENDTKLLMIIVMLFLLTIIAIYLKCFHYLKKISSQVVNTLNQPSSNQPASDFNVGKYKRSLVTMVMVLGVILTSFLPIACLFSSHTLSEVLNNPSLLKLCESFTLLNSILNPILYFWRMKDLRQALKIMFGI
jgi:hypothetical protein